MVANIAKKKKRKKLYLKVTFARVLEWDGEFVLTSKQYV
jgi:hypothetical protein